MWSGMAVLPNVLISNFYMHMKVDFPGEQNKCWEESPLEEINLKYAAVDGYASFQLYHQLRIIDKGRQHLVPIAPPPPPPAPQPPIATYCPSFLEKESSRGAKHARLDTGSDDGSVWKKKDDSAGGLDWKKKDDDAGGSGWTKNVDDGAGGGWGPALWKKKDYSAGGGWGASPWKKEEDDDAGGSG